MKNQVLKFDYNKTLIEFETKNDIVMVNATQMAKLYNKKTEYFLKTDQVKAFIKVANRQPNGGQIIENKGRNGVYFNRILALKFAAWLSPEFEYWVYSTLDEITLGSSKILQKSLKDSANRKNQIDELENKLNKENDTYIKLQSLKLQERQAKRSREKVNVLQIKLFREIQELAPATSN